jgi:hypothetical protein
MFAIFVGTNGVRGADEAEAGPANRQQSVPTERSEER